jgi:eukaryotic-like serine/threonine-protein kinase
MEGRTLPTRIAHYEVLDKVGEGGMGIVYRARDSRLDRFVAIKVLPADKTGDPERRRRFVQEAKAASALNHAHLVTIHDIASQDGMDFIVMEYLPGRTLDQLIPRNGMRPGEVVKYAIQIASGLAAAHEAGIVHRDLKPGNIMVGDKGEAKVLDFGLAKLIEPRAGEDDETRTLRPQTEEGAILGTVAYMSPEQAEGRRVDHRSDIFSFGAVLFEMVIGQRPFRGDSKLSTLNAILHSEPPPLPPDIPRELSRLINRCLRKDPERRVQTMADLKVALEEIRADLNSGPATAPVEGLGKSRPARRTAAILMAVAASAAVLVSAAWLWLGHKGPTPYAAPLTSYPGWEIHPSFSPDGGQVAFAWRREGSFDIYVKQLGVEEPFRLTSHPSSEFSPAWSPDGAWIAFLRIVDSARVAAVVVSQRGGSERILSEFEYPIGHRNLAWTPDGKWLVAGGRTTPAEPVGLFLLSLETGEQRRLTLPEGNARDISPSVSPDGRSIVFSRNIADARADLYLLRLTAELTASEDPQRLPAGGLYNSNPAWTPNAREILFSAGEATAGGQLWRMAVSPRATPKRLSLQDRSADHPAVSARNGRVAYTVRQFVSNIWRADLSGPGQTVRRPERFIASTYTDLEPDFSPDGARIAFMSTRTGQFEIWICNRDGSQPRQLTSLGALSNRPRWSPDGEKIVFYSDASGNREVYTIRADGGTPVQITFGPDRDTNPEWSRDGRWIYFISDRDAVSQRVWKVPAAGGEAILVDGMGEAPLESADGRHLYFGSGWPDNYKLHRVPMTGGPREVVVDALHPNAGWRVVDDGIYYARLAPSNEPTAILFKNFATGSVETVAVTEAPLNWGLTVSPDRLTLLFTQLDHSEVDLMLIENFR